MKYKILSRYGALASVDGVPLPLKNQRF